MDMLRKGLLAVALVGGAVSAHADQRTGFELGIGVSRNDVKLDTSPVLNDDSTGYTAFIGYRFLPWLAVEANWWDAGEAEWAWIDENLTIDGKAYGASVLGTLPFGETGFALLGRAGYMRGELKFSNKFYTIPQPANPPDPAVPQMFLGEVKLEATENAPFFGVGVRGMLDEAQVRLEYMYADFDDVAEYRVLQLSVAWLL